VQAYEAAKQGARQSGGNRHDTEGYINTADGQIRYRYTEGGQARRWCSSTCRIYLISRFARAGGRLANFRGDRADQE